MAYIGQTGGVSATITNKTLDTMTGDGSDTTLTLSQTPASVNDVAVYLDGVFQRPTNEYTLNSDVITFTTAPPNGVFVCAITGGGEHIGSPMTGSVTTDTIIDGTITNAMISSTMSSSKLTGVLPAISGVALTGIPTTIIKNASDPATDTNPSGGLGTVWANTTDGEMFILTDATTDENVWYNVGGGEGDVQLKSPVQGAISGFVSGGYTGSSVNTIDKYSFTSDGDGTDVGDLTFSCRAPAGQSSTTHGYTSGGIGGNTTVQKIAFSAGGNAVNVGSLAHGRDSMTGQSSATHGYTSGGNPLGSVGNAIDKYSFSTEGTATDVGDLSVSRLDMGSQCSITHGYTSGGYDGVAPTYRSSVIDKFSFTVDGNATDVGDLTVARSGCNGQSTSTHGYSSGGYRQSTTAQTNVIDKFTFASDANSTDVGDLTQARGTGAGHSSLTHGYNACGQTPSKVNTVGKFTFASDANATDVGDMTVGREGVAGTQF